MFLDRIAHEWLKIPYTLNYEDNQVKKPRATLVFIHGIGNSIDSWREVIAKLPSDVRIIAVDLLGFGDSPKPDWATYSTRVQAQSVMATLVKCSIKGKVILVGHSLGSMVSIEIAKGYPWLVRSMILCSPPLYLADDTKPRLLPRSDKILKSIYNSVHNYPDEFVKLKGFAVKYGLANPDFDIAPDSVDAYMATLKAAIINQTSYYDAVKLAIPTHIIQGTLDPFVVARNLKQLTKDNHYIKLTTIVAAHEVRGSKFVNTTVKAINSALPKPRK